MNMARSAAVPTLEVESFALSGGKGFSFAHIRVGLTPPSCLRESADQSPLSRKREGCPSERIECYHLYDWI